MHSLNLGPLHLTFNITLRVKDDGEPYNLPPSFGYVDIYKVSDYETCPESWDKNGYFIAIHDKEATWINFQSTCPVALLVSVDGINVLNAKHFEQKLEENGYLTVPPQPWLDGWKNEDGTVSQFVCTSDKERAVGCQLGSQDVGMKFFVYEPKNSEIMRLQERPQFTWGDSETDDLECCRSFSLCGMGRGGSLKQKVYKDPYGLDKWKDEPVATAVVYLIDADEFTKITGKVLTVPPVLEQYNGPWYGVKDDMVDVAGSEIFKKIKGVCS